ncbi:hypothetical protein [Paenibacillus sp. CMAA1364]
MNVAKSMAKQVLAYLPYRYVNVGKEFFEWQQKLERLKEMSEQQILEAQFQSFNNIVNLAYHETTFYRELYDNHGFHPSQLKDPSDIQRIPTVTKLMAKERGLDFIVSRYDPKKLSIGTTSGTTGSSLTIYSNRRIEQREWAATCYLWSSVGYQPGDGRIEFRGYFPGGEDYTFDRYHRVLRINVTKLTGGNIHSIWKVIHDSGYEFMHGYPSSLSQVSKLVLEHNMMGQYLPTAILMASENIYEHQVATISAAFPTSKLHGHYGQSERTIMAGWTDDTKVYSFVPLYGYVEKDEHSNGLIGTSFINDVMPFIRYELMDMTSDFIPSPHHARHLFPSISSIDGRSGEMMYKPNGDMVSSSLVAIAVRGTKTVTACKLIQHQYNEVDILVETFASKDQVIEELQMVLQRLKTIFTESMNFNVQIVDNIPRQISGKLKTVEVMIGQEGYTP